MWMGVSSPLRRERGLPRPPCGGFKWKPMEHGTCHSQHHMTSRELSSLTLPIELPRAFLCAWPVLHLGPSGAAGRGRQLWCSYGSVYRVSWGSHRALHVVPHEGHMHIHANIFPPKPKLLQEPHLLSSPPPLNSFAKAGDSYPYLFVFPLYRFLKIRNLPDKPRLFLLQLSDFLRKGTDRKGRQRVKAEKRSRSWITRAGRLASEQPTASLLHLTNPGFISMVGFFLALLSLLGRKPA